MSDTTGQLRVGMRFPLAHSIASGVIATRRTRIIHDARQITETRKLSIINRFGFSAYIGAAVRAFRENVAFLCVVSRTPRFWPDSAKTEVERTAKDLTTVLESPRTA